MHISISSLPGDYYFEDYILDAMMPSVEEVEERANAVIAQFAHKTGVFGDSVDACIEDIKSELEEAFGAA